LNRTVVKYGLLLAAGVLLLQMLEYFFFLDVIPTPLYIVAIAVLFTLAGIWTGNKITAPKTNTGDFHRNQKAIEYLQITDRELQVLGLVAEGLSNKEISAKLYVSLSTVKTHLAHIYEKMDVNRRTEAVKKARSLKLIP